MRRGRAAASRSGSVGVLDAGVVLARLDRRRRGHAIVVELFERSRHEQTRLYVSIVNLAEVLQHAREYTDATGLDPVTLLAAYRVELHQPDVDVARRAARLASLDDASLADRFAVATADTLGARLFTTEATLASHCARLKLPVTRV